MVGYVKLTLSVVLDVICVPAALLAAMVLTVVNIEYALVHLVHVDRVLVLSPVADQGTLVGTLIVVISWH